MNRQTRADAAMTAAVLLLAASLLYTGTSLLRNWEAAGPGRTLGLDEAVGALAAGAGVAIALWWFAAMACAVIAALAERTGRHRLAAVSGQWSPAFMRRLVLVVLGLNLVSAPLATAAPGGPIDPRWHAVVSQAQPVPSRQAPAGTPSVDPIVDPTWQPLPAAKPSWLPRPPASDPGPIVAAPTRPGDGGTRLGHTVVVHAGDSLWSIAAQELGPYATDLEVSQAWPQWYRANRAIIGDDPDAIVPGQILHSPNK
ncbi:LysM peptidoglycan-binding domain-containing protein [Specibacter cremeus]|uniref:LysM peptidoglycan-binding domain-containing protein n=1 Tax=Specibacter cremeus TaxID=1629051 RepID=UPI000F78B2FB|nr:LysM domain-containing protein [Specibacter cremeus]